MERSEPFAQGRIVGTLEQAIDPRHKAREDVCHVPGPRLPIPAVATPLDDLGIDCSGRQIERRKRQEGCNFSVDTVSPEDNPGGRVIVQVDLVDLRVEPVVV